MEVVEFAMKDCANGARQLCAEEFGGHHMDGN